MAIINSCTHTHVAQCYAKIPYHQCGLTGFKLDLRAENALTMSLAAVHYRQVLVTSPYQIILNNVVTTFADL